MSEKKPDGDQDPVDALKTGLGNLFRAAKDVAKKIPTDKVEGVLKAGADEIHKVVDRLPAESFEDTMKTGLEEMGRAFTNVATTIEGEVAKAAKKMQSDPPPNQAQNTVPAPPPVHEPEPEPGTYDDAYAPEPDDKK